MAQCFRLLPNLFLELMAKVVLLQKMVGKSFDITSTTYTDTADLNIYSSVNFYIDIIYDSLLEVRNEPSSKAGAEDTKPLARTRLTVLGATPYFIRTPDSGIQAEPRVRKQPQF